MENIEMRPFHPATTSSTPPKKGASKTDKTPWNSVILRDCLIIADEIPISSIDFLYLDPPFFTKRNHIGKHRSSTQPQEGHPSHSPRHHDSLTFSDRWASTRSDEANSDRREYLHWLEQRIRALKPLLTPTAVFLLHLDWHAVHYAKVLCDAIFGDDRFQNELIWYYQTGGASKDRFSRKHDTILLYSNGPTFPFNGKAIAIPRTPKAMKRAQCPTGARIKSTDTHKNPDDVLVIPALNPMAKERTGYPTQKPVELLERLILALTPPNGTVADFCCGSGTTLVAAKKLHRRFIGCDSNPHAVALANRRLAANK